MRGVNHLKDRWHDISQMSLFRCATVQQHWLEKKSFLPWRSMASTEGGRGDVGKVPEQVAAAGVIGERWQGHRVCCWQAVGSQSSGTTESRGNAEMVARDGGAGQNRLSSQDDRYPLNEHKQGPWWEGKWCPAAPKWLGRITRWKQGSLRSSSRCASHPALTCQKAAPTGQPLWRDKNKEKGNVVILYFPFIGDALLCIHSRNNDFREPSRIPKCSENPEVLRWNQRVNILL